MSKPDTKAIRERVDAASPADQWGQKWSGTLGRGEIRVGPPFAPTVSRFHFEASGFGNAGTAHPDFQLAINAPADLRDLLTENERLRTQRDALREACADAVDELRTDENYVGENGGEADFLVALRKALAASEGK